MRSTGMVLASAVAIVAICVAGNTGIICVTAICLTRMMLTAIDAIKEI